MRRIMKRMTNILTANMNALVDQAEDPEKMIRRIMCDMEENICLARQSAAEAIASEKRIAYQLKAAENDIEKWARHAEACLKNKDEAMARTALFRKKESEKTAASLSESLVSASATSHELKQDITRMGRELEAVKRKSVELRLRQRAAETKERRLSAVGPEYCLEGLRSEFSRMESKVMDMEAMAEAMNELNRDTRCFGPDDVDMVTDQDVDDELARLKEKIEQ